MFTQILKWPRSLKRLVVVALDIGMALAAMWLAFTLRLDVLHRPEGVQWVVYALAPAIAVPVFVRFGLYRAIFRYTGLAALIATGEAVAVYGALLLPTLLWMQWMGLQVIPRSVGVLQPLIFLLLVASSRALARFWLAGLAGNRRHADCRVLIYGAGNTGAQTAAALASTQDYALLGFLDDDPAKEGRSINGVEVYASRNAAQLVQRWAVTDILLALPGTPRERRNQIIEGLHELPVRIRALPGLEALASGRVTVQDFRELDIEDLLGREPVPPDPELLARNLTDKVVLVTGAGGSIGSELCRQIIRQGPQRLLLLDHSEFGLYSIHRELLERAANLGSAIEIVPLLASVVHYDRVADICVRYRPSTIYHAAAYKHVPMVEANAAQGVLNNVFGTLNVARAAIECQVSHFVLISTDKAVRPTNIMGATKRIAEMGLQALAAQTSPSFRHEGATNTITNQTSFSMVRFGNVLGSSGSVVPLFREQLAKGGPLTVTHPEVTRYFMTISEAAQLVLQAGAMADSGDLFVLDMGKPVKIIDLARRMVTLSGLTVRSEENPNGDIDIAITGLRPGEKLYEELLTGENPLATEHPRIMKAREAFTPWPTFTHQLRALKNGASQGNAREIRIQLWQMMNGAHAPQATVPSNATH
jgi:FlaA1/EpsC-like NDP-sugar epimerase